mmetsp:Transcript_653/g.963  ORF Transcript_653/g.963 Transcript_653/m.963 type:complete len:131 (+) Transcript_653:1082-1474(+)
MLRLGSFMNIKRAREYSTESRATPPKHNLQPRMSKYSDSAHAVPRNDPINEPVAANEPTFPKRRPLSPEEARSAARLFVIGETRARNITAAVRYNMNIWKFLTCAQPNVKIPHIRQPKAINIFLEYLSPR